MRRLAGTIGSAARIIVVDDGSTDDPAEAARGLTGILPRMRIIRHERNLGLGAALLTGWRAALTRPPA